MAKLIFDIETVGEDFDALDEITKASLIGSAKKEGKSDSETKNSLSFSPLTGKVVAIGVYSIEKKEGRAVYFETGGQPVKEQKYGSIALKPMAEKDILAKFWEIASRHTEFITFNGRSFDVPFINIRSAIHAIRATKDLMSNRYLNSQKYDAKHIDLYEQLTYYGSSRSKGSLHLWTRAFGIESPKAKGVSGADIGSLFQAKKYLDIAKYNADDLIATKKLYDYWDRYLRS